MNFFRSERSKIRLTLIGIVVLFSVTAVYVFSEVYNPRREAILARLGIKGVSLPEIHAPSWIADTFRLGLDLKGGTHLVYDADLSRIPPRDRGSSLEGVREVVERRVNAFGVSEPVVQTVKAGEAHRVIVELAGVHDVNEAIKLIGETPLLEFKEQNENATTTKPVLTPEQQQELDSFNRDAEKRAQEALAKLSSGTDFGQLAKEVSDDTQSKENGGQIGWLASDGQFGYLEFIAEKLKTGETTQELFNGPNGYEIVKLVDTRDSEKEVRASHILICYKGSQRCERETSKEDAKKKAEELKGQATKENFAELAKQNSTDPSAQNNSGDLGFFKKGAMIPGFEDAAFNKLSVGDISGVVETEFGFHIIYKTDERPRKEYNIARILIGRKTEADVAPPQDPWKDTGLTGKQLKRAFVDFNTTTGFPEVGLEFNDEGKKLFGELTKKNVGKPIAIVLDKGVISAPRVNQEISSGQAVISGDFDLEEAKLLAQRLNTGALPVPISLASQQTVGATLGEESLKKSLNAGLLGFALVVLFMIGFYRLPGLVAVCALVIYTALVLAIFKLWPVTLSLAGIAGFILSVGMAVDANILIFERMKEELRWGKSLPSALENGFKRAWTSIRDSNVSSLITCAILFWFSASLIKGFAFTLAIGILVSMFSAIFITRVALKFLVSTRIAKNLWLFSGKRASSEPVSQQT